MTHNISQQYEYAGLVSGVERMKHTPRGVGTRQRKLFYIVMTA